MRPGLSSTNLRGCGQASGAARSAAHSRHGVPGWRRRRSPPLQRPASSSRPRRCCLARRKRCMQITFRVFTASTALSTVLRCIEEPVQSSGAVGSTRQACPRRSSGASRLVTLPAPHTLTSNRCCLPAPAQPTGMPLHGRAAIGRARLRVEAWGPDQVRQEPLPHLPTPNPTPPHPTPRQLSAAQRSVTQRSAAHPAGPAQWARSC